MGHQAHIPLDEDIPGLQIPLGPALQAGLLLLRGQGLGKGAEAAGEVQGQKQAAFQQQHRGGQHGTPPFLPPYVPHGCPYARREPLLGFQPSIRRRPTGNLPPAPIVSFQSDKFMLW